MAQDPQDSFGHFHRVGPARSSLHNDLSEPVVLSEHPPAMVGEAEETFRPGPTVVDHGLGHQVVHEQVHQLTERSWRRREQEVMLLPEER